MDSVSCTEMLGPLPSLLVPPPSLWMGGLHSLLRPKQSVWRSASNPCLSHHSGVFSIWKCSLTQACKCNSVLHAYGCTQILMYRVGKLLSHSRSGWDLRNSARPPFSIMWDPVKCYLLTALSSRQTLFGLLIMEFTVSRKGVKATK